MCAAGTTYEQALTSAASAFAKNPSKAGINQALSQAKQATDNLKTTLKGLGKPGTPAGQAARSQVNDLVTTISGDLQTIQHAVTNGSALQATTTVAATVPAIRTSITQTIDKLKKLNGSELKASFAAAPACATFKSSGGS